MAFPIADLHHAMFRLGFMGQCYSSRNEPKLLKSRPASRLTTGDLLFLKGARWAGEAGPGRTHQLCRRREPRHHELSC